MIHHYVSKSKLKKAQFLFRKLYRKTRLLFLTHQLAQPAPVIGQTNDASLPITHSFATNPVATAHIL
jgi:hypothetical protein